MKCLKMVKSKDSSIHIFALTKMMDQSQIVCPGKLGF